MGRESRVVKPRKIRIGVGGFVVLETDANDAKKTKVTSERPKE